MARWKKPSNAPRDKTAFSKITNQLGGSLKAEGFGDGGKEGHPQASLEAATLFVDRQLKIYNSFWNLKFVMSKPVAQS